jgi:STE24 endopeptidase
MNEEKSARYHRLKRRVRVLGLIWTVLLLAGLVWTGVHALLRDVSEAAASYFVAPAATESLLPVVIYVVLLSLLSELGALPLAFYGGYVVERRYGLATETIRRWAADQAKSFGVGLLFGGAAAALVYFVIRQSPDWWWLGAGALFAALIVGLTNVAPVLLLPLFYRVKPLGNQALRARLLALADRSGAKVLGAYEWGLGEKTRKANAALAGLGATRRILVSDTMLAEYSDDEIEVVLAHELAHHVHGDIWKGIVFETVLILCGFYVAAGLLSEFGGRAGLRDVADPAGLPLLLLAAGAVSLVAAPVAHAVSRAHERRADRFALDLTRNPAAFISAMRRLAAQNLAEERPPKLVEWLFYSHPPIRERIAAAQAFSPRSRTALPTRE